MHWQALSSLPIISDLVFCRKTSFTPTIGVESDPCISWISHLMAWSHHVFPNLVSSGSYVLISKLRFLQISSPPSGHTPRRSDVASQNAALKATPAWRLALQSLEEMPQRGTGSRSLPPFWRGQKATMWVRQCHFYHRLGMLNIPPLNCVMAGGWFIALF